MIKEIRIDDDEQKNPREIVIKVKNFDWEIYIRILFF
jgi:hypothetical protein